jgi:hypothetical protein
MYVHSSGSESLVVIQFFLLLVVLLSVHEVMVVDTLGVACGICSQTGE